MPTIHIFNATIILPESILKHSSVTLKGSKIFALNKKAPKGALPVDARGAYLSPGFIDTHIHGNPDNIIRNETKYGTTAFVAAVSCGRPVPEISGYSGTLGVRLEGPYINPAMAGAQDKRYIWTSIPHRGWNYLNRFHPRCGISPLSGMDVPTVKMMTLAPEMPGAGPLIRLCKERGVIPSIGHSDASYEEAKKSFDLGIRHATHLFNAISGPRHGTAGAGLAALFDKRVTVEVIADLKHVRPELLRLVFAVKDPAKIMLITDSVRAEKPLMSTPGVDIRVAGAGHMIDCVKNVVKYCGVSLIDAVRMASTNPAGFFGAGRRKGSIAPGKDADLVIFDKNFNVKFTVIGGKIVYQKKELS